VKKTFIFHGAYGDPTENWYPWLAAELTDAGFDVTIPRFPTPEGQTLSAWREVFRPYEKELEGSILVGHSLGATFALRLLESVPAVVDGLFLVSPFSESIGKPEFDTINASFYALPNVDLLMRRERHAEIFHGDNDPYVSVTHARSLADGLGAPMRLFVGGGHLNASAGFSAFPVLRDAILVSQSQS